MKRALLAICCAFFLASPHQAMADPVFDQDMASRYLRAAQSGDDEAQFYIGALYSAGVGVPRSDEEALLWLSRAAAQGHSHAMLILSGLYAVGRGVSKDNVEAYKWAYIVNAASRVEEFRNGSRQLIGVLESRMSPEEINNAKSEAGRWHPVVTKRPAQAAVPPASPSPPLAAAAPAAPASAAPSLKGPAKSTSNELQEIGKEIGKEIGRETGRDTGKELGKSISKGDVDSILDQLPQGLRKKFGF